MDYEDLCYLLLKAIHRALKSMEEQNFGSAKQTLQIATQQANAARNVISKEHTYPIE
ncbi:MAG: hypothetical protein Q3985_02065 [Eubacteriales bacterium]|nr:hypothetical protein [Eubacteriales bacterium]